jgi:hypothetical protein
MPWYMNTAQRTTWHVVDQVCDGKRTLRSHRRKRQAIFGLQRHMQRKINDGCTLLPITPTMLGVFRDGIPIGWIGYERCNRWECSGCDPLEEAA